MQIVNGDKVLLDIPLPEGIDSRIERLIAFVKREEKYVNQVLLMLFLISIMHKAGMI